MKKILYTLSLMICTMFFMTAYASGGDLSCDIDLAAKELTVTGSTGGETTYALLVLNPGYTPETAAADGNYQGVQVQYEGKSDGTFRVKFPLNTDLIQQSGVMNVYVSYEGISSPLHTTAYYASEEEIKTAMNDFIGISDMTNTNDIVAVLDKVSSELSFDSDIYQAIDKTELAARAKKYVQENDLSENDYAEVKAEMKAQILLSAYHQIKSDLLVKNDRLLYAEELGFSKMDEANRLTVYGTYMTNINAVGMQNVNQALMGKQYDSLADIQKEFAAAAVVEGVRNYVKSGTGHISSILRSNAEYVGLDLRSYTATAAKDAQIKTANASTLAELQKVIDTPVSETGSGGGSGGSSGGGSSGRGNTAINLPETPDGDQMVSEIERDVYALVDMTDYGWADEAVKALMRKGIISIPDDPKYRPGDFVTREEAVKLLVAAFEIETSSEDSGFIDVSAEDWSAKYISAAKQAGIVTGVTEDLFDKTAFISREDMAVMIMRCLTYKQTELSAEQDELSFTDGDEIASYAKEAVAKLTSAGVINGMGEGRFAPKESCTRAQCAVLLYKLINR